MAISETGSRLIANIVFLLIMAPHPTNDSGPSPINHNKHHLPRVQDDPIRNAKSRISETATAITSTTQKRDAFGSLHALAKAALSINTERTPPLPTRTDLSITRTTPLPTSPIKAHPIARSKPPLAQISLQRQIIRGHFQRLRSSTEYCWLTPALNPLASV